MDPSVTKRPSLREGLVQLFVVTGWLAAILVLDKIFHQGPIAYVLSLLIMVVYIAWFFMRYWQSMGWLSLPKRKRTY